MGLLAYLVTGRLLGLFLFGTWPGRWRTQTRERRVFGESSARARQWVGVGGSGIVAWAVATAWTGSPWLGVPIGAAGAAIPLRRSARTRERRLADLHEAWPDGLRHLVASVRSGSTVETALIDLSATGPEPLRAVFTRFAALAEVLGVVPALEAVRDRIQDPTTDRVVEVLIVAHEVGGRVVPGVLEDLAAAVTADLRTVEEIRTSGFEQRLNARIVFAVPWAVLLLLTSRDGLYRTFYLSRPGTVIVLVAAVLCAVALVVVGRLGKEPLEQRVLTGDTGDAS